MAGTPAMAGTPGIAGDGSGAIGGSSGGGGGAATNGGNGTAGGFTAVAGGPPAAGTGGTGTTMYQPLCDDSVVKGSACDNSSVRFCYRTCGPDSVGYKSETCQRGAYVEQSGCDFPASEDYSCYQVPRRLPTECPPGVPRAADPCQIAPCVVCFGGTTANPLYQDSTGTQKDGYCVCSDAGAWTCGSTTAWPCPGGSGCN